ncbi:Nn.00g033010.m01.CDS01 [Neocucurbitaria sp. VM-36]
MTKPVSSDDRRKLIWAHVYEELLRNAIPDSRFNYDFLSFTPDFRGSASALDRVVELPCYQNASTLLVTSDNSLEQLRCRALKDGKRLLVATYRLRRGFILLSPTRISEDKHELAACLDGMEKPGVGRAVSLAQIRDEDICIDMCLIGGLAFNEQGVVIWEGQALFEVQWALLQDIKRLASNVPVVAVAHTCQVVDETQLGVERIIPDKAGEVQCDHVVTPDRIFHVEAPFRPTKGIDLDTVDPEALSNIPPLQELKGIRMMEKIMESGGFSQASDKETSKAPTAEEQMGIGMVERLMKGYKP